MEMAQNIKPPIATPIGIITSCFAFIIIGALQAFFGPMFLFLMQKFSISTAVAGTSLSALFIGAFIGVVLFHKISVHLHNRKTLIISYLLMAFGCVILALANQWFIFIFAAFLIGLGFGCCDLGLNYLFSIGFNHRSVAMVNLLNAHFGVGAIIGPLLIGYFGPRNYPLIFIIVALCCMIPILFIKHISNNSEVKSTQTKQKAVLPLSIISAFFIIYIFHVAIETGVGGWEPTHLEYLSYSSIVAATATSLFWAALTSGRFIAYFIALYVNSKKIMIISCAGMTICLFLAMLKPLAIAAYIGVGLFIAPIFPTGIAWLNQTVPNARSIIASVIAASMIGGILFPPLIGSLIKYFGVASAPLFMAILSSICVCSVFFIIFKSKSQG